MTPLEVAWEREMYELYDDARRLDYNATYFLKMVQQMGGVGAAHKLLEGEHFHEGFTKLWELGKLDLSVEARVLKPEYSALFTDEERARARRKLADLKVRAPWDPGGNQ